MKGEEQLYLWGSCRSSLIRNHSAWPAMSYYPGLLQHTGGCCNSSGQSSGTSTKTPTQYKVRRENVFDVLLVTHGESIAPLPAAVVHGVSSVQSDPKPVLLMFL